MGYGYWTLTYDTAATTHEKWKEAMDFYQEGKLTGIRSMEIHTTIDENGRSDHLANLQWIDFYCENYDKNIIMEIGKSVLHHLDYSNVPGFVYYYDNGNQRLYSLPVTKTNDSFKRGKILLQIQRRFGSKFESYQALYTRIHATDCNLELWHKDLTKNYNELCKKWNDLSEEYENESTNEERRQELSEEVAFLDIEYMKKKFDPLHRAIYDRSKLLSGEVAFEYNYGACTPMDPYKNTFNKIECRKKNLKIGFWCLDCTYLQDMCRKCILNNAGASTTGQNVRTSTGTNARAYTGSCQSHIQQQDQIGKLKQRKLAKKQRAKNKVKSVILKEESQDDPYDMEKVLEALGEVKYYLNNFYKPNISVRNR